jgi:hypothetical protein
MSLHRGSRRHQAVRATSGPALSQAVGCSRRRRCEWSPAPVEAQAGMNETSIVFRLSAALDRLDPLLQPSSPCKRWDRSGRLKGVENPEKAHLNQAPGSLRWWRGRIPQSSSDGARLRVDRSGYAQRRLRPRSRSTKSITTTEVCCARRAGARPTFSGDQAYYTGEDALKQLSHGHPEPGHLKTGVEIGQRA